MSGFKIRDATYDDLPGILEIHNDVLLNTNAIWEEQPADLDERRAWMSERFEKGFPILVAENNGSISAFASYGTWRARCGYFKTVEHSVHVHCDFRGQGLGSELILKLIGIAKEQGRHVMLSGISADNEGSLRLHKRLGFHEGERIREVGYKFGRWLDLIFVQKIIGG